MILRWHNPDNGRYYQAIYLGPDLFGDAVLWRGWCGADGKRGGERKDSFTWEEDCLRALKRCIRRRKRRRYVLLDGGPPFAQRERAAGARGEAIADKDEAAELLVQVPTRDALGEPT
jgi:predicted DNA-binding WGR domain protein